MANWQTDFKLRANLVQRDIYAFENELRLQEKTSVSLDTVLERTFAILRALSMSAESNIETQHNLISAIKAGWIENPVCEVAEVMTGNRKTMRYFFGGMNVEEMHPGKVRWYGKEIAKAYNAAVAIPDPNS